MAGGRHNKKQESEKSEAGKSEFPINKIIMKRSSFIHVLFLFVAGTIQNRSRKSRKLENWNSECTK